MRFKLILTYNFTEKVLAYFNDLSSAQTFFKLLVRRYQAQGYSNPDLPVITDDPTYSPTRPVYSDDGLSVTLTRFVPYSASTDEIVLTLKPSGSPIHPGLKSPKDE